MPTIVGYPRSLREVLQHALIPADLSLNVPIIAIDPAGELARNVIDGGDRHSLPSKRTLAPRLRSVNVPGQKEDGAGQPTP